MIISMDFLEAIKRSVENRVLVCFKVPDVYFPAVFMVGKKVSTLGMTTLDHVITLYNCTIIFEEVCKNCTMFVNNYKHSTVTYTLYCD